MTLHKSLGSELGEVAVVLPPRPSEVVSRELLCTAVTRARRQVTLYATPDAVATAIKATDRSHLGAAGRPLGNAERFASPGRSELVTPPVAAARRQRRAGTGARRPTYGAATRLARIVHGLHQRPAGWSFDAIQRELDISERTLLRYVKACREELVDERERCIVEVVRRGGRRVLRLAAQPAALEADANPFELLYLYFALTVFQFLEGTVIKESIDGFWKRVLDKLPRPLQLRLTDFQLKFYAVPHMMKDYRASDDVLDAVTQGLLYQSRLRLRHRGLTGEEREHEVDPYTLMMYRGGLYLIARSHRVNKTIYFAVERISAAERLAIRFTYPRGYSPQKHIEGIFGIIDGPQTAVEVLIRNRETAAYLSSRRIHPTQRFREHRDGTTTLTMTVRGTAELVPWLVGLGDYVEVVRPAALRQHVQRTFAAAARLYNRTRPRGRAVKRIAAHSRPGG